MISNCYWFRNDSTETAIDWRKSSCSDITLLRTVTFAVYALFTEDNWGRQHLRSPSMTHKLRTISSGATSGIPGEAEQYYDDLGESAITPDLPIAEALTYSPATISDDVKMQSSMDWSIGNSALSHHSVVFQFLIQIRWPFSSRIKKITVWERFVFLVQDRLIIQEYVVNLQESRTHQWMSIQSYKNMVFRIIHASAREVELVSK